MRNFSEERKQEVKDLIHRSESGVIDFERSIQIIRELAVTVHFNPEHNILVDLSETTLSADFLEKMLEVVMACVSCRPHSFERKIATLVPDDHVRNTYSKLFETGMQMKDFKYRYFTDHNVAVEWLSN